MLGANDGVILTASLIIGVASAHSSHGNLLLTGVAGMIAGAMSMATGEYVSVSSHADTERAALAEEKADRDPRRRGSPVVGARLIPGMLRVMFWSALSMGVASVIGNLFGAI